jgi:hypothetical protein
MSKNDFKNDNTMINFYEKKEVKKLCYDNKKNKSFENTNMSLNSRILIIAQSGGGKSIWLMNYLARTPEFHRIIIVHKINEPLYDYLQNEIDDPEKLIFYKSISDLPDASEFKETEELKTLLIFDDLVAETNKKNIEKIENFFLYGRKCGLTMVYLSQSYHKTPIFIRAQCNYIILLKISSNKEIRAIIKNVSFIDDPKTLKEMYDIATKDEKFSFLKIDVFNPNKNKVFSKNWIQFFEID